MGKSVRNYGVILCMFLMSLMLTGPVYAAPEQFHYRGRPWYRYGLPPASSLPGWKPVSNTGSGVDEKLLVRDLTADETHIFKQVNAERARNGLPALQINYRLLQTARAKSLDMIKGGYFAHQSPTLGSPFDQMKKAGIPYRYAGENIAGNSSAAGAMVSWMKSSGHRANILNPKFSHIGIGVVDGGPYGKMLTQQFIG